MRDYIIRDEAYAVYMAETVEPFLAQRSQELRIPRGSDGDLYCMHYKADGARGIALLSHGFTETAEKYKEIAYYFVKHGFHVYLPEHCGHGRSYRLVEDLSLVHVDRYERYVQDFLAVADAARCAHPDLPLFLYGHSMGGGIAAAVLSARSELFEKAVLSSPMIQPLTGSFPWPVSKFLAAVLSCTGKARAYVPGGHAFDGEERFEDSASTSRARFDYYQAKRNSEPLYQMTSASCGWVHEAARLNRHLMRAGCKRIRTPILLFQSESDAFVSCEAQKRFAEKVNRAGRASVQLAPIAGTRHEIFNSNERTVEGYWEQVFRFLQ